MSASQFKLKTRKTTIAQIVGQIVVGGAVLGAAAPASALNCTWNPATGNWGTAGNWSCGVVPTNGGGDTANIAVGQTVTVDTTARSASVLNNAGAINIDSFLLSIFGGSTNSGTITAGSAGTSGSFQIINHTMNNAGGTIVVGPVAGSFVDLINGGISGGTLSGSGAGVFRTTGGLSARLTDITLTSGAVVNVVDNSNLVLSGTNTNNGAINLNSVGNSTDLRINGATALNGTGTVTMSNTGANRIIAHNGAATDVLTVGAGQTIQGGGQLGAGGLLTIVNNGVLRASQPTALTLNTTSAVTNNNVIRGDGASLVIQSTTVNQGVSGTLNAINNGVVRLHGATINNGSFTTASGGSIATQNGTGSTLSGVTNTGTLNIVDNSSITLTGTLTNNGTVNMQSVGNSTDLRIAGAQTINGTGTISLSNTGANRVLGTGTGDTLTLGSGQTLQGSGTIGTSANFTLVNQGTIVATQSSPLYIGATAGVTNTGTLRADGGTLQLQTTVNSGGGAIEALNGSQVQLLNGAVVNNASFTATGAGSLITTVNGSTVTLGGGTVNGPLRVNDNSTLRLTGDVTYNGTLSMASVGNSTNLEIVGNRTLSGTATIQMSNTQGNRILTNTAGDTLAIGANITVQGSGQIGAGTSLAVTNNGTIIATQPSPILINTAVPFTNNGTLRADGGTLQIQTTVNSAGGNIEARNGSQVQLLNGTVINNANFSATGAGSLITTVNGSTVALGGGNITGPLNVNDNSALRLDGDVAANGTITMSSVGNSTDLRINGTRSISGPLTITMSNTTANRIISANVNGDTLTTAANVTIQGAGQIGAGSSLAVTNNGTIIATQTQPLLINTTGTVTNNNVMRADGAAMVISSTVNQGPSGTLNAINNGQVQLVNGSNITGGTFTTASGGVIRTVSGNNALVSGVTNSGTLNVVDNSFLFLGGTLTNNGAINMQSVGNSTDIRSTGNRLIDGTGTITLSNTAANRIIANTAGDSLTLGSGQTLQGAGQIGAGGQFNFTNNGTVIANVSNGMTIDSSGTLLNNNIIRADAANLTINSASTNLTQSGTGVIQAINGGTVTLTGNATITGGILSTASGGAIRTGSGNISNIANLTNNGTFNVVDNSFLTLTGTITNNGALNVNSAGNTTDLRVNGNVTLAGTGTTTMSNTSANRIVAITPGDTLTIGAGQTVQGSGAIGALGGLNVVNQGTITANQPNALVIAVAPASTVTNAVGGLMQSNTNGTLNLSSVVANNGTIAANGGVVNATAGFTGTGTVATSGLGIVNLGATSTVGTIQNNGTSTSALNLGANNITVSSDYNNANFGSGNTFNARQNVAGTGQILAAGTPANAQVITGANVTNGGTTTPTLTIGNVRVGNNTFNYDIANNNVGGPAIRGAIQTTVGGASISDARLTGSGVTAGNFSPVAAGNSQSFNVNFNAASAGVLAPLAGQVVRVANNFDNVAEQNISIQLAANAAAYNLAQGAVSPSPTVQVANQRVLGNTQAALTITNTGPVGAFTEKLNASFTANTGAATNNLGTVSLLTAGVSNNTNMSVGVNTATSGAKTGTMTIGFQSDGTGTSGLAAVGAGSQVITVNGNVYQVAQGQLNTAPLNFGTVQVGQVVSQNLSISNIATGAAGFVEDLKATFGATSGTGAALISGTGQLTGIQAGQTSNAGNGTMTVNVNTAAAGVVNGAIAVNFITAGAVGGVSNGLGELAVGQASYGVQGNINAVVNVINQASPLLNTPTINLGNVRVGAVSPTANVSITNVATVAPQAALNASITGNAPITASGSFNLLNPGATNNSALSVGMNTGTAGAVSGMATIALVSDASNVGGCAPNCQLNLASQNVTVTGGVYQVAQANVPATVNLGNQRIGTNASQAITITNTNIAPAGFQEGLNAAIGGTAGATAAGGPITNLAAGASSNAISVGMNVAGAGAHSGTVTLNLASNGTGTSGLADFALPNANVTVNATGYRLANPVVNTPTVNLAARVGDASPSQVVSVTNQSVDAFREGLNASISTGAAGFTATGTVTNLGAQANSGNALNVALNTATAGNFAGIATLSLASNGTITNNDNVTLASQNVALNGKVYTAAEAIVQPGGINFGIVHVNEVVGQRGVSVQNNAPITALNDTLRAQIGGTAGPFTNNGANVAGLVAGGPANNTALTVGLNTATAGVYNGTATIALTSQNPDMIDLQLAPQNVALSGQVNKYANAVFDKVSGAGVLTRNGTQFILDFGNVAQGSGALNAILDVDNLVGGGPADLLDGALNVTDGNDFTTLLNGAFQDVAADGSSGDLLSFLFNTTNIGLFTDEIALTWFGHNASGYRDQDSVYTLLVRGNVIQAGANVPEPSSLLLIGIALAGLGATRRRKAA